MGLYGVNFKIPPKVPDTPQPAFILGALPAVAPKSVKRKTANWAAR